MNPAITWLNEPANKYFEVSVPRLWRVQLEVTFGGGGAKYVNGLVGGNDPRNLHIVSCLPSSDFLQPTVFVPTGTTFRFDFPIFADDTTFEIRPRHASKCYADASGYDQVFDTTPAAPILNGTQLSVDALLIIPNTNDSTRIKIVLLDPQTGGPGPVPVATDFKQVFGKITGGFAELEQGLADISARLASTEKPRTDGPLPFTEVPSRVTRANGGTRVDTDTVE